MIEDVLRFLFEYISIITCAYKVADEKIKINAKMVLFTCWYWVFSFVLGTDFGLGLIPYIYFFLYVRFVVCSDWKKAVKTFALTVGIVVSLQVASYLLISRMFLNSVRLSVSSIISSLIVCLAVTLWKKKYWDIIGNNIRKIGVLAFIIFSFWIFYIINILRRTEEIPVQSLVQLVVTLLAFGIFVVLWISTEKKKQQEAEELRMYQLYTDTFKDTIKAIRMKQHEFDNHINALRHMGSAEGESNELMAERDKYCEDVLSDNEFNKLLKLNASPILSGYLYSKFTTAKAENGISISYEIADLATQNTVSTSDLVEIIGVLFDNAVDALKDSSDKAIRVSMYEDDEGRLVLKTANISRRYSNSEIEKFFKFGYSTKGENRGVGLKRVMELTKKHKAELHVENVDYEGNNFLEFVIVFNK